jgi:dihydrofolate reductase
MPTLTLIAAFDETRAIGKDNTLPWRLPEDLKRFKALTMGKPLLMGRKTAESLGRALPGRANLVLTRSGQVPFEGMLAVANIEQALSLVNPEDEIMVIGGGDIYALTLPFADKMYLTEVETRTSGADAFFPHYPSQQWEETQRIRYDLPKHDHPFSFVDYKRKTTS